MLPGSSRVRHAKRCGVSDDYAAFLDRKRREWAGAGLTVDANALTGGLYPFQAALTRWALRKGRAALFADTGLGKTRMQVAWAAKIPGRVLILAPLCVGEQTIAEAAVMGVDVRLHGNSAVIEITNYERLHHIDPSLYTGVVLDESSILKAFDGKTRTRLIAAFQATPYRLCCTATPAPNDIAELANHCEFLGIMTRAEMLATFFVHDDAGWRLKGHAHDAFYRWLASWGMFLRRPSDLGFSDDGYELPPLTIEDRVVATDGPGPVGEYLFRGMGLGGVGGRMGARRLSLKARVDAVVSMVESTPGQWLIWCGLNDEQDAVAAALDGDALSIDGRTPEATKIERERAWRRGDVRVLVSKPSVFGWGMNWQHCAQMAFLGLGDSYETYYQSIRRCWRFGQTAPVRVVVVVSDAETEIVANVRRKERDAADLAASLIAAMQTAEREELGVTTRERETITREVERGETWTLHRGDSVEVFSELPSDSVDLSVYSPPFQSLYTYTNSERDIGNSSTPEEFLAHYAFIVREMLRVTKPGRLTCVHVAQVTTTKATHGVIGLRDLRGAVIDLHIRDGWIYHGDVTIDKDPQAQAIRTHSKALLFVQLRKDASWLRPALADYILVFRKPGDNAVPIHPDIGNEEWIEWARPIWYGIRESDTLNVREGRANDDDRHICPLQLGTIERCIRLWSNRGDVVADPFAGLGSTGHEAIAHGRRFIGCELKPEYWRAAVRNLTAAEHAAMSQLALGFGS